jgi:hypothetical protein
MLNMSQAEFPQAAKKKTAQGNSAFSRATLLQSSARYAGYRSLFIRLLGAIGEVS